MRLQTMVQQPDRPRLSGCLCACTDAYRHHPGFGNGQNGCGGSGSHDHHHQDDDERGRQSTTDRAGRFNIPFVEPGTLHRFRDRGGFRRGEQQNVLVQVTETRAVNFVLEVGTVTQSDRSQRHDPVARRRHLEPWDKPSRARHARIAGQRPQSIRLRHAGSRRHCQQQLNREMPLHRILAAAAMATTNNRSTA